MAADPDPLEESLRALRHRDRSARQIDRHLAERGLDEHERLSALATLARTGLVDDRRFAASRAAALVARGAGDALIRHDLGRAGIEAEIVEETIAALESELERARRVLDKRGGGAKAMRYLAGKGFAADVVHAAVAEARDEPVG